MRKGGRVKDSGTREKDVAKLPRNFLSWQKAKNQIFDHFGFGCLLFIILNSFQGAYGYRETDSDGLGITFSDLAEPLTYAGAPRVLFAGEATTDNYYSAVHGAVDSARYQLYRSLLKCSLWRKSWSVLYKIVFLLICEMV